MCTINGYHIFANVSSNKKDSERFNLKKKKEKKTYTYCQLRDWDRVIVLEIKLR